MTPEKNGCGTRHLKAGASLLAILVFILGTLAAWQFNYSSNVLAAFEQNSQQRELRVRTLEQAAARNEERLEAIRKTVDRIETKLERNPK